MNKTKPLIWCALFACLITVGAQLSISLPMLVPITLQTIFVMLCGLLLDKEYAFLSCFLYLCMGAIGLNVFSNFRGGMSVLLGPTGGFIFAFPIAAYVISYFRKSKLFALLLGNLIIYTIGIIYFMILLKTDLLSSLYACVIPFIAGDLLKIGISLVLSKKLERFKMKSAYVKQVN